MDVGRSIASALTRKLPLPPSKVMSSGAQMLTGGVLLALGALVLGEFRNFHPSTDSRGSLDRVTLFNCCWFHRIYSLFVADSS